MVGKEFPGKSRNRVIGRIKIVHADRVKSRYQIDVCIMLGGGLRNPLVDNELVIKKESHPIIGCGNEPILAGGKKHRICPANGKIIRVYSLTGRTFSPIKIDKSIRSGQCRGTRESSVIKIFSLKSREKGKIGRMRGRCWGYRDEMCNRAIIGP